jgi:hypothetical protein
MGPTLAMDLPFYLELAQDPRNLTRLSWDPLLLFLLTFPVTGGGGRVKGTSWTEQGVEGGWVGVVLPAVAMWGRGGLSSSTKGPCVSSRHLEREGMLATGLDYLPGDRLLSPTRSGNSWGTQSESCAGVWPPGSPRSLSERVNCGPVLS